MVLPISAQRKGAGSTPAVLYHTYNLRSKWELYFNCRVSFLNKIAEKNKEKTIDHLLFSRTENSFESIPGLPHGKNAGA